MKKRTKRRTYPGCLDRRGYGYRCLPGGFCSTFCVGNSRNAGYFNMDIFLDAYAWNFKSD